MEQQHNERQAGGGAFSVDRMLSAVRRRLRIVIATPIVVAALSSLVVLSIPNRFDASAVVQIDPRKKTIANLDDVMSGLKADSTTVESEVEIIRSRAISLKVIDLLDLRNDPEFSRPSLWRRMLDTIGISEPELPEPQPTQGEQEPTVNLDPITGLLGPKSPGNSRPVRDEVAVAFAERLKVTRVRATLLIDIRFSAGTAVKAARIANTISEVYLTEQINQKHKVAGHASKLLEEKLDGLRHSVTEAERSVAQFKAEHNIFDSEGQILGEKQMARLMEQTVVARNTVAEARAKYELALRLADKGDDGNSLADVLQNHTLRLLREQLAKVTAREAELSSRYGPRHPEMQKVRAEVGEAREQLMSEIRLLVPNLKNELQVAETRQSELERSLATLKSDDTLSKEASVKLKQLQREADSSKALYEALLSRFKQTVETQSMQLPDARIVEQADAPLFPASPKRKQIVMLATFGGGVLGVAIAILLELLTFGIGRPEDVESVFDLAHLTSLPAASADVPDNELLDMRRMVAEPAGPFAEAMRELRREVDVRRAFDGPRIVQVTSALPGEGVNLVASNLALHYAMTGARTLLIDGDLRRAHLTRTLAPNRRAGLAEALSYGVPASHMILADSNTNLNFLPAIGTVPSQLAPPELLGSRAAEQALAQLKAEFDIIIVDAPPLLPVIDARVLADHADQIVFVLSWRRTPKQLAKRALASLGFNQSKLIGVVVSQVAEEILADKTGSALRMPPITGRDAVWRRAA